MADVNSVMNTIPTAWGGHQEFAAWLVNRLHANVVVDLGVDHGFSSLCFAAAGAKHVFGIDSFEGDAHAGFRNTQDEVQDRIISTGLYNLHLIRGYFDEVAINWSQEIDILHIDGRHDYDDVKNDYLIWRSFVRKGGVILMHDTEVESFGVSKLFTRINLPKLNFKDSSGLGVLSQDKELVREIEREFQSKLINAA